LPLPRPVPVTIEHALDIRDGFWGLLAHGAGFSVPGRRPTSGRGARSRPLCRVDGGEES
jgi:hypothetical protein